MLVFDQCCSRSQRARLSAGISQSKTIPAMNRCPSAQPIQAGRPFDLAISTPQNTVMRYAASATIHNQMCSSNMRGG